MDENTFTAKRRTLRIILVLSIIYSGFSCFSYLTTGLFFQMFKTMFETGALQFPAEMTVYVELLFATPRSFFLCSAILYAASLVGVILMWNLHKGGFHLYTLSQLLILLITVLFLGKERLSMGDVMLTILFVTYYYMALRNLGVFSRATNDGDSSSDDSNTFGDSSTTGNSTDDGQDN